MRGRAAVALLLGLYGLTAGVARADVDPPAHEGAFAPHLASALGGGAFATWIEPLERGARVRFARFRDGAWSEPVTLAEGESLFANWADTPGVEQAGDGSLAAWWLEKTGGDTYAYGVRLARSVDGGRSWSALGWLQDDASASEHGFVSMVAEGQGLRAFWLDGRATPGGGPMSLRSTWIGAAVAPSREIDPRVCDCCKTAAAHLAGGARVAYRDRSEGEIRDIAVARVAASGELAAGPVAADGWKIAGCPVNGPALAVVGDALAVAWYSAAGDHGRVALAFSADGGERFAPPLGVDEAAPLGRVALAPSGDGEVVVGWIGRSGDRGEVRLARANAERVAPPLVVATTSAGRTSGFPQLVPLGDGSLLVAWSEAGEGPARLRARRLTTLELPPP